MLIVTEKSEKYMKTMPHQFNCFKVKLKASQWRDGFFKAQQNNGKTFLSKNTRIEIQIFAGN